MYAIYKSFSYSNQGEHKVHVKHHINLATSNQRFNIMECTMKELETQQVTKHHVIVYYLQKGNIRKRGKCTFQGHSSVTKNFLNKHPSIIIQSS